ncbi:MAG: YraN family protein [Syntrophobacterales bacterium]|nr:YraN family protein [Syntrophobacterales bacterium]
MNDRRRKGQKAEDVVETFLRARGLEIVERNFSNSLGEVDIIARDGKYIVFVEVRSSSEGFMVHPLESITKRKLSRIVKVATSYLKSKGLLNKVSVRFDVVTVVWHEEDPELKWIKGAIIT